MASSPIRYEELVERFERAMLDKLRQHTISVDFLELWVPDADPVRSIVSMVDSARLAGEDEVAIRFDAATVPEDRFDELSDKVDGMGTPRFTPDGDAVVLRVSGLRPDGAAKENGSLARRSGRDYWSPGAAGPAAATRAEQASEMSGETAFAAEFADVHPVFHAALAKAAGEVAHEGRGEAADGLLLLAAEEDGIGLSVLVDPGTHAVREMRHHGADRPTLRAILDTFCGLARSLPLHEVNDHIGLKTIDALRDAGRRRPVSGVILPSNAGPAFQVPIRLIRKIWADYTDRTGLAPDLNYYQAPPSDRWQSMSKEERADLVAGHMRDFLVERGLAPDSMALIDIVGNRLKYETRIVVAFSDAVSADDKPGLMRALESVLRERAEPGLELIAEMAKDKSPLRRLS